MKALKIYIFCSLFLSVVFLLADTDISTGDEGAHNSNQQFGDSIKSTNDEAFDTEEEFDKIIKTDPNKISLNEFYELERRLMRGITGSGGYFLDKEQIAWLKKCELVFRGKGIELKEQDLRRHAFMDSYYHVGKNRAALKEARAMKDPYWIENLEWLVLNGEPRDGKINIKEYRGPISHIGQISDNDMVDTDSDLFVSFLRGPVVRYNKQKDVHSVIYMPFADEYSDCRSLEIKDNLLSMKFADKEIVLDLNTSVIKDVHAYEGNTEDVTGEE